jgi:hypothetical protein
MRGISWLADDLLASQEGLCSMELVSIPRGIEPDSSKMHVATLNHPFLYAITMHMGHQSKNFARVPFSGKITVRLPPSQSNFYSISSRFYFLFSPTACPPPPPTPPYLIPSLLESLSGLQTFHCICWWFCLDARMTYEVFARSEISLVTVSAKQSFVTALSVNVEICRQCSSLLCRNNFTVLSVAMKTVTFLLQLSDYSWCY